MNYNELDERYLLLNLDEKNYIEDGSKFSRTAVRGIIKDEATGKYALVHSSKYGEYKFQGGGMNKGETKEDTLIREVGEEAGLVVKPETAKYIGYVIERRKGDIDDIFEMISHYYICNVEDEIKEQNLDDYEKEYGYELEYISLEDAIKANEQIEDITEVPWVPRDTGIMKEIMKRLQIQ